MVLRRWLNWFAEKASRDTTSGQLIPEIDGLRFVAIFSVIFFHLTTFITSHTGRAPEADPLAGLFSHGAVGVQLFFVISGFVIALPFAKGHLLGGKLPGLRQYFFRRLTRLEPPYIVNLLIRFVLMLLLTEESAHNLVPHLLASMGYLHGIIYAEMSTINFVAWSLEVELQFYILAPFLCRLFMVRRPLWRRSLLLALIALFSWVGYRFDGPRLDRSVLNYAQYFLTGFLLVDVYLADLRQSAKSRRWDLVSAAAWLAIAALLYQGESGELLLVAPIFLAYCAAFKGTWSNWFFSRRPVYVLGGMCYTLYLYHFSVISALGRPLVDSGVADHLPLWLVITGCSLLLVPLVVLSNGVMFILFEKPCMKRDWYLRVWESFRRVPRVATVEGEEHSP